MQKSPIQSSRQYKMGIIVVAALLLAVVSYSLVEWRLSTQDDRTYNTVTAMADKLNSYTDKQHRAPQALSDANIKDVPSNISYTRISDKRYVFCANYHTNSAAFAPLPQEQATELFFDSAAWDKPGFDASSSLYITNEHHRGKNCEPVELPDQPKTSTITPTPDPSTTGPFQSCGFHYYYISPSNKIESISENPSDGKTFTAKGYDPSIPATTYKMAATTKYLNYDCTPINYSDIAVGDSVSIYQGQYSNLPLVAIVKGYKYQ